MRREFGCNQLLDRFIEQDLKFELFGNLGLNYTLGQSEGFWKDLLVWIFFALVGLDFTIIR